MKELETVQLQERLKDFALIDKKKSEIDTKRSKPEKGLYFFKRDQKVRYKILTGSNRLGPYWYHWIRNDPNRINRVMLIKGYDFVTPEDDVIPEGIHKNAEGHYQYGDLVLMKCSLTRYLQRKIVSRKRSDSQLKATLNKFKKSQAVTDAGLDKALLDEIVGDLADIM